MSTQSVLFSTVLIPLMALPAYVQPQKHCSQQVIEPLEQQSDQLRTWDEYYRFIARYERCHDDAGVDEGLDESLARLLVDHWNTLPRAQQLIQMHPWLRKHIRAGATMAQQDLEIIESRTRKGQCSRQLGTLCRDIHQSAVQAMVEQAAAEKP